jgi:HlyD family secretion protein
VLKRWIKRLLGLLVLTGLVGGIVYAFLPKPVPVDFGRVTRGVLQVAVEEDGRTRIKDRYIVSAPLAGKLDRANRQQSAAFGEGT